MKSLILDVVILLCLTGILIFTSVEPSAVLTLIGLYVGTRVAQLRGGGGDGDGPSPGSKPVAVLPSVVGAFLGGLWALRHHGPRLAAFVAAAALVLATAGCPSRARPVLEQTAASLRERERSLSVAYAAELEICLGLARLEEVETCGAETERAYAGPWAAYSASLAAWTDGQRLDDQGDEEQAITRALEAEAHAARAVAP
jgi:hypothetical protein